MRACVDGRKVVVAEGSSGSRADILSQIQPQPAIECERAVRYHVCSNPSFERQLLPQAAAYLMLAPAAQSGYKRSFLNLVPTVESQPSEQIN